jgi:ABC-type transporter Mla subunit MlaD
MTDKRRTIELDIPTTAAERVARQDAGRVERAINALRKPDQSLANVANTIRQSIAEVIEELQGEVVEAAGLRTALQNLNAEVCGSINAFPHAIRDAIGNTNFAVLQQRSEEATASLRAREHQS